jgi:hypothetical protein
VEQPERCSTCLHIKNIKNTLKILYLQNIDSDGVIINNKAKYNYTHKHTNKGRKRVMEDNAQKQSEGQMNSQQVDFSGRVLSEKDAPEKVDLPDKKALSEQDILEPSLFLGQQSQGVAQSADQQTQGSEATRSLAPSGQRTLARPISSDTAAALRTFRSVLAQPPIPKLPPSPSRSTRSSRRRLPVALIGLSAALAAIILLVVFLLPTSSAPQHSGKIANAPATTTTGKPTPPTGATTTPPGKGTQPPSANNPTQPPINNGGTSTNNGGNVGANPPPNTGTNPQPTPIPVTPIPVANSGVLTVTPGIVHVNNVCTDENDGVHCVLTVAPVAGRTDLTLWTAQPENLGLTTILPFSTIIAPGHQQQVTVILHNCMNGGDIRFTAEGVAAVVPFYC